MNPFNYNIVMKKKGVKYTEEYIGKIQLVDDFLPKPKDLILKDETVKVTLSLSRTSVDFFKRQSNRHHSKYQKMIRALLDQYTDHYKKDKSA